jgi:hypothetical protein
VLKVPVIADSLKKTILKEHKAENEGSQGVSAILSSAGASRMSHSEDLLSLLNEEKSYSIFKFDIGCVNHARLFSDVKCVILLHN